MSLPPFQAALDEHQVALARYLVATVGPDEADDALQETLISALRAYPRLRSGSNVRAWLFAIAHNKAIDTHRARARSPVPVPQPPERVEHSPPEPDPELWKLVQALPDKQRSAVALRFVADLSHREIATALECSEEAARRSLSEGLAKLRRELT